MQKRRPHEGCKGHCRAEGGRKGLCRNRHGNQRVFSMYGGKQQRVSIRFINPLPDTAKERFGTGKDVFYHPENEKHFVLTADVEISNQFFA